MKLMVFTNAREGREDEYNEWYNGVHLKDLLSVPGVTGARRYQVRPVDAQGMVTPPQRYLAIYEVDGDITEVLKELGERSGSMLISDALDLDTVAMTAYEEL